VVDEQVKERVRRVRRQCVAAADRFADRLPTDVAATLRQFVDVGEYGLFTETLCAALANRRIPVTRAEHAQLAALTAEVEGASYQPSRYLTELVVADAEVTTDRLVDLARQHVLRPDETVEWTKAFPEGPTVYLDTADRSFTIQVVHGEFRAEHLPWVAAIVAVSRQDQDLEGPPPRDYFIIRDTGDVLLADDLGPLLHTGELSEFAYMELLVKMQWPGGWAKRVILDPAAWRADHPAEATLPPVTVPRVERLGDAINLTFAASRERAEAVGGRTVLDVQEWTVRATTDAPATWQRHTIADAVPLMPPW
jgi:hypothetical protein